MAEDEKPPLKDVWALQKEERGGEAVPNDFLAHLRRALNAEDETFEKNGFLDQLIKGIKSFFAVEEDPVAKENEAFEVINERLTELNKKLEAGERLTPEQAKEFETLTSRLERMLERASNDVVTAQGLKLPDQETLYKDQVGLVQNMLDTTRAINAKQVLLSLDTGVDKGDAITHTAPDAAIGSMEMSFLSDKSIKGTQWETNTLDNARAMRGVLIESLDADGNKHITKEELEKAKGRLKLTFSEEELLKIVNDEQATATSSSTASTSTQSGAKTESNQAKSKELGKEQEPVKIESLSPEEVQMNQLELLFRMNLQRAGKPDAEITTQWEKLKSQVQDNPEVVKQMVQDEFAKHQAGEVQRQFALREDVLKKSELVGASVSGFAPLAPLGQAISATAAASRLIGYFNPTDDMQPAPGLSGMGQAKEVTPQGFQSMGGQPPKSPSR